MVTNLDLARGVGGIAESQRQRIQEHGSGLGKGDAVLRRLVAAFAGSHS